MSVVGRIGPCADCCGGSPPGCAERASRCDLAFYGHIPNPACVFGNFTAEEACTMFAWDSRDARENTRYLRRRDRREFSWVFFIASTSTTSTGSGHYELTEYLDPKTGTVWKRITKLQNADLNGAVELVHTSTLQSDGSWAESGDDLSGFDYLYGYTWNITPAYSAGATYSATVGATGASLTGTRHTENQSGDYFDQTELIEYELLDAWTVEDCLTTARGGADLIDLADLDAEYVISGETRAVTWGECIRTTWSGDTYPALPSHTTESLNLAVDYYMKNHTDTDCAGQIGGREARVANLLYQAGSTQPNCFMQTEWEIGTPAEDLCGAPCDGTPDRATGNISNLDDVVSGTQLLTPDDLTFAYAHAVMSCAACP